MRSSSADDGIPYPDGKTNADLDHEVGATKATNDHYLCLWGTPSRWDPSNQNWFDELVDNFASDIHGSTANIIDEHAVDYLLQSGIIVVECGKGTTTCSVGAGFASDERRLNAMFTRHKCPLVIFSGIDTVDYKGKGKGKAERTMTLLQGCTLSVPRRHIWVAMGLGKSLPALLATLLLREVDSRGFITAAK
ncbi:hypothetical protein FVEN_g1510 [Fusarium venenatum]|uniref:Uncharacterized protein n=1 Tax=Fusarium venenatum TaxID=56646 RepID=A0A2L2T8W8_9HYPO|nr:uncharacterized protein FVRRES_13279 [Fusarium venenatum]KAG8360693.1 hypothetical protein FVEN_g1510 [Fusarium venenatum]CEI40795.1 unnamed protein product [Fusarium venenatum]